MIQAVYYSSLQQVEMEATLLGILYSLGIPKALQNLVATTDMFHCK
jgi:hypothetical protein